jgi:hypothetical protein
MRKNLAILLISVHLVGNTEVGQLFKFPQLVNHFFQHHQLDPGLGFFDFITMHYAGDDGTTADDDIDSKLPCHNVNHNTTTVVYSPMVKELPSAEFPFLQTKEFNDDLHSRISSKYAPLILQPPRHS